MDSVNNRKACSINQCLYPSIWFNNLSFPILTKVGEEDAEVAAGVAAVGVTLTLASNNNSLLNDTSQTMLPSQAPAQKPTVTSDVLLDYPPQCVPPEGIKTLSATTLRERKRTPCFHTPPEGVRTSCIQTAQEGEKTPCFHTPQEGVKTPCVQSHIVFIQDQVQKRTNLTVGSRLKSFLPVWKTLGAHRSILNLIVEGYKLPFREHPKLSRIPCITSGFADFNKQSALSTAIQDLLHKGAIDIIQKLDSFLQSFIPGPKTRQPLEASNRPKLSQQISGHIKVHDGDPRVHTSFSQKERMGHLYRPHRRLPPHTHSPSVAEVPPVLPQRRLLPVHQPSFRASHSSLQDMFRRLSLKSVISTRTLMSTIGLLASMEKTVKLGRMHMRPFQWHLKTHWKFPMPLDTPIPWNQKMI